MKRPPEFVIVDSENIDAVRARAKTETHFRNGILNPPCDYAHHPILGNTFAFPWREDATSRLGQLTEEAAELPVMGYQIAKMVLSPGDILLVRWSPPEGVPGDYRTRVLADAKECFRGALAKAGLDSVQVIVFCNDFDLSVLSAVELLAALRSGHEPEPE